MILFMGMHDKPWRLATVVVGYQLTCAFIPGLLSCKRLLSCSILHYTTDIVLFKKKTIVSLPVLHDREGRLESCGLFFPLITQPQTSWMVCYTINIHWKQLLTLNLHTHNWKCVEGGSGP